MEENRLLNIKETSEILGISKATLYTWICRKRFEVVKVGNRAMFDPSYIRKYIEKHTIKALLDY